MFSNKKESQEYFYHEALDGFEFGPYR